MLKKYFIMAIAAVFALVACTEKFDEPGILPAGSDNVHTLSVGIEAGTYTPAEGATKASMEAVIRVNWTANDEVSVVNATKGKILGGCLKAQEGGTSVVFEGTVTGTINQGDKLYYIYPKLAGNTDAETEFSTDGYNQSLANQTYNGNDPGKVCFYGYAEDVASTNTISKKIQFNLVTSYAHLNMANLPAKGADLSSLDISNVNEGFTWTLSDATLTAAPYAGSNSISVDCTNSGISQSGNAVVRFAIPSSAASEQDRVITVNNAYKNKNYTKAELLSSSYHNQLYTSWESNVSVTSQTGKTEVTITNEGSTEVAEGVLPVSGESSSAFDNSKPTEISLGGLGTITFDQTASAKIKSNATDAGSTEVFFKVEDVTATKPVQNANIVYEVTMKTVDEQGVEVFSTEKAAGVATVTVPLGEEVQDVTSVALVNESGAVIDGGVVDGSVNFTNGILTFKVNHFSKYAIKYTTKAEPESGYVAQIGGRKYETLASAIAAAQNGNTIQMIADFTTTDKVTVGLDKNIVLDLNGKTISYTTDGYGAFITNCGYLTITDSSNGKNGKITACHSNPNWMEGCYTIDNSGQPSNYNTASTLVIEAGTIENTSPAGLAWPINNGSWGTKAELIINGGTIHSVKYVPVREYLHYGGKKTIVINGGKFISDNSRAIAVQVSDATIKDTGSSVTINGGEFTCNGSGILYIDLHAANVNMTGFAMTVNGGKFSNSNTSAPVLVYDEEDNSQTSAVLLSNILKGGIYSKEPAAELIPFGYHIEANTDSQTSSEYPWRVVANSADGAEVSVSKPGQTTVYSTLAAFRDATNAGNTFEGYTVKLLKDIDLTDGTWIPIGTDLYADPVRYFAGVFDGNNHTIKLKKTEIDGDYGLFMQIWGEEEDDYAIVKNLKLDVDLSSKSGTKTWIGGLTDCAGGYLRFENIEVTGKITSGRYAAGFVGFDIYEGLATFENCVNKADITVVHPTATSEVYSLVGGFVAQFDYSTLNFISCRNEGKLKADHTSAPSGASYMGHMAAKGNYDNEPLDIIITNCSFSENAEISGWNVKSNEINSYPFEGKILGTDEYTYGAGTPNRGKQMIGGYFKSCSLDGVVTDWTYPNGNN